MKDTAAIIVAGGQGLRFGGKIRKQYIVLNGKPILEWSLRAFQRSPSIAEIILVMPADDLKRKAVPRMIRTVAGGVTRAQSVANGLAAVSPEYRYVAVHDAVRPFVTPQLIENVLRQARRHRAAIAAAPSKDTVKLANGDGCIHSTPPRSSVWLAQTPQIFERTLLERAHARRGNFQATDDAQLVERLGVRVRLVEAPAENLKVTRPMDLLLAKAIAKGAP